MDGQIDYSKCRPEEDVLREITKRLARPSAFAIDYIELRPGLSVRLVRNFAGPGPEEARLMQQSVGIKVQLYTSADHVNLSVGSSPRVLVEMRTEDMLQAVAAATSVAKMGLAATWDERRTRWVLP